MTLPAMSAPGDPMLKFRHGTSKILLELYTSQGCSSCPSADALLPTFIAQEDIIALSMSVDYWDYLGWRDTFGHAKFTKRQHSYARQFRVGHVYTPQVVVDGLSHHNGADESAIQEMIEKRRAARAKNPPVDLGVGSKDGTLIITVGDMQNKRPQKKATLWMALVSKKESVEIRRGENRGKLLTYHNVVRNLTPIGHWNGEKMTVKLPKKHISQGNIDGCVILLQDGDGGPIVAAVEMNDW
ncbi:MAG: DUF1223 domain-containing protein [bacterium]|nr:DUF1223 domain-containing protein [bacterium]